MTDRHKLHSILVLLVLTVLAISGCLYGGPDPFAPSSPSGAGYDIAIETLPFAAFAPSISGASYSAALNSTCEIDVVYEDMSTSAGKASYDSVTKKMTAVMPSVDSDRLAFIVIRPASKIAPIIYQSFLGRVPKTSELSARAAVTAIPVDADSTAKSLIIQELLKNGTAKVKQALRQPLTNTSAMAITFGQTPVSGVLTNYVMTQPDFSKIKTYVSSAIDAIIQKNSTASVELSPVDKVTIVTSATTVSDSIPALASIDASGDSTFSSARTLYDSTIGARATSINSGEVYIRLKFTAPSALNISGLKAKMKLTETYGAISSPRTYSYGYTREGNEYSWSDDFSDPYLGDDSKSIIFKVSANPSHKIIAGASYAFSLFAVENIYSTVNTVSYYYMLPAGVSGTLKINSTTDPTEGVIKAGMNQIVAKVNGNGFTASSTDEISQYTTYVSYTGSENGSVIKRLNINGMDADGKRLISLKVYNVAGAGKYNFDYDENLVPLDLKKSLATYTETVNGAYLPYYSSYNTGSDVAGSVVITRFDRGNLEGYFYFYASPSSGSSIKMAITEASFRFNKYLSYSD